MCLLYKEDEMSEIEVLEIVIQQIGELRVPVRETELRNGLEVVLRNLTALKEAVEKAQGESVENSHEGTEVNEDV